MSEIIESNLNEEYNEPIVVIPIIEEGVPLPADNKKMYPSMKLEEEIQTRAETIKVLSDISQQSIDPDYKDVKEAEEIVGQMMNHPELKPEFANYPNETMAYLAGMVAQSNCMLVKEYADYKVYVVNGLVKVIESADSLKDKIAALKALGDVDGVDAFKKQTIITHVNKTGEELEKELRATIEQLKGKVIEGEIIETSIND
jgi:hypothetical protein